MRVSRFLLLLSMAFASVAALAEEKKVDNSKRIYLDGSEVPSDAKYLAEKKLKDGTFQVYRQTENDIKELIKVFKAAAVKDKQMLDPKFWAASPCGGGRDCSSLSCTSGSCQDCFVGHIKVCKCKC